MASSPGHEEPHQDSPAAEPSADILPSSPGADSAVDAADNDSSYSLTSSIVDYPTENHRSYHAFRSGRYLLPNDPTEQDRLDMMHHISLLTSNGKLFHSDFSDKPASRVLDAGTGTGIWAMDYADAHPEAHVIGVDLSPIQPTLTPPNCEFIVDDLESPWESKQPFDFIFVRSLSASLKDWSAFIAQARENLSPRGWIELQDHVWPVTSDDKGFEDTSLYEWSNLIVRGAKMAGQRADMAVDFEAFLKDAGFINVTVKKYRVPIGTWPLDRKLKELGNWVGAMLRDGIAGISLALLTRVLGLTSTEAQVLFAAVRNDIKNPNIHAYTYQYVVCGQKGPATDAGS